MAERFDNLGLGQWVAWLRRNASLVVPLSMIGLLGVIIVPLPPVILDVLIAMNLSLSAVMLLTTIYIRGPLEFSAFPSMLLATTLFRLVLNVASTRLILSADATSPEQVTGVAGKVIQAFSSFVTGGTESSVVIVGVVIFIILIIVQFVVITKGATRVSEVAARFTLDAMPGRQMAVDADLNAGLIDETQARERREKISDEADFYGAMDGASKFVRGDAIAGIVITLINIIGGFAIGVWVKDWDAGATLASFTKLTIGDGLVSQIPSFIIAIAAGLIVTRSGSKTDLGSELTSQLTTQPLALGMTAIFLAGLSLTGLPTAPLLTIALVLGGIAWMTSQRTKQQADEMAQIEHQQTQSSLKAPTPVEKLLKVDTLELIVGYGLVRLVDTKQGGDLLDRITRIRQEMAVELGIVVPSVRIHDNIDFQANDYQLRIRGNRVAEGQVRPGQLLAIDTGLVASHQLNGDPTQEPAFGLDAWWIDPMQKQQAEADNYMVAEASSVLATHLTEVIKSHADEMLTREETNALIEQLKEKSPNLVEEVVGEMVKPGEIQKVLQNLLRERVPVRDLETILETLSDWVGRTKDIDILTEYVRNALRRTICHQYTQRDIESGVTRLYCVTLDPAVEDLINGYIERTAQGTSMSMPPQVGNQLVTQVGQQLQEVITAGHHPVVLASPQVRGQVKELLQTQLPTAAVLGYNEIVAGVEVESLGLVQLPEAAADNAAMTADRFASSPATEVSGQNDSMGQRVSDGSVDGAAGVSGAGTVQGAPEIPRGAGVPGADRIGANG